mmetsp:Transcript_4661/g.5057  ORF Transcript_4661/g.5057 Transcript_4661/m.5057 type:complete len:136 (-) Transcript_4661:50-457(-)
MRIFIFVSLFIAFATLAAVIPHGSYCGEYDELASIRIDVLSETLVNLNATVFGSPVVCDKEAVQYDPTSQVIVLPDIKKPDDCVGKILLNYGVDPSAIAAHFDPSNNTVALVVEGYIDINMEECKTMPYKVLNGL